MRMLRMLPAALLLLPLLPGAATAQGDALDITFTFKELRFTLLPHGFKSDSDGSGLRVNIVNVSITDENAVDLRNCIDGQDEPSCSYGSQLEQARYSPGEDAKDRTVQSAEVEKFQGLVATGINVGQIQIETLEAFEDMLRNNITIDGKKGGSTHVAEFVLRGAEGGVSSGEPVYADVTLEMSYPNDKAARTHTVAIKSFHVSDAGFAVESIQWRSQADGETWRFLTDQTKPVSVKNRVSITGWTSQQTAFEDATDTASTGLVLVAEKTTTVGGKKKTPGFESALVVLALLGLALGMRRRW